MKFYQCVRKIVIIFLPINFNICFVCSKEPSHRDGSFEYPQHMFWMRNKENSFPIHILIRRPDYNREMTSCNPIKYIMDNPILIASELDGNIHQNTLYIKDIYFLEVNTKYISLSVLKTSEFSRGRSTSEISMFVTHERTYLVFTEKKNLFILYFLEDLQLVN